MTVFGTIGAAVVATVALAVVMPMGNAAARPTSYANCTTMHVRYRGGVSRPGAVDHRRHGGHARYKPYVNRALYEANVALDRDHDGIACEQ